MTKLALPILVFLLTLRKIYTDDGLNCTSPLKCICIETKPYLKIGCRYESLERCDKSNLENLLHLKIYEDVTLINCAEKNYFPHLMTLIISPTTVKLHHLAQEKPSIDALSGNVKKLELKRYSVEANAFDYLPQIIELTIQFSRIKTENPFHRLPNLRRLNLSFNGIFSELKETKKFFSIQKVISQFNILTEHTFESLGNLRQLNLAHNSILVIEKEIFRHLVNVEEIDLGYNFIQAVGSHAFALNTKLRILNLRNNKIKFNEVYGGMMYPKSLEILDLRSNNLTYFLAEWMRATFNIDLRNNDIKVLDLQALQNALSKNKTFDVNNASEWYGVQPYYKSTVFLSGNPVTFDANLGNLLRFFNTVRSNAILKDEFDFSKLKCAKTTRYLCLVNETQDNFCPKKCACLVAPWEYTFVVNCTSRLGNNIPKLSVPNFWYVEVHLEENALTSGPNQNMGFDYVTKLYMSNNHIDEIRWIPEKLEVLELHNNNLHVLNTDTIERLNKSKPITQITLHGNPWSCSCESSNFVRAMQTLIHHKHINAKSIKCGATDKLLINLTDSDLCPTILKLVLILSACITALGLSSSTLAVLYYKYGHDLKIYLFVNKLCLPCVKRKEPFNGRTYDAFVCYNFQDEDFVCRHLLPVLEGGPNPYRICIHVRDWIAGELITQQMIRSIEQSKRTVVVMSPDYLKSNWAMMELRFAYDRVMEGTAEIIIILYRDIDFENIVDEDLKQYLKTCLFIKWNKPRFWDKLKYALPHR